MAQQVNSNDLNFQGDRMKLEAVGAIYAHYAGVLGQLPRFELVPAKTALLVVDMQYMDAHPDFGVGPSMRSLLPDSGAYYFSRLSDIALPNTARLIEACRSRGIPVMHSRNATEVPGGREIPWRRRFIGPEVVTGSREAEFLEEVAPGPSELVFNKTTASAFNSTVLEFNLRNMGVETLIVAGVVTNMCVESTVRDGGDRGFQILLVEDACAAMTPVEHENAIAFLDRRFANVAAAQQVLAWIREHTASSESEDVREDGPPPTPRDFAHADATEAAWGEPKISVADDRSPSAARATGLSQTKESP